MKRSLISALVLVVLAVAGLLLLTVNWSAGGGPVPAASNALTPGSTLSITATLTYSDFLTLSATDIWSIPTPIHTVVIPTEWPFLPKPTYPTSTPRPTPTLLPELGVRLGLAEELTVRQQEEIFPQSTNLPRIVSMDTDGKTLVGVTRGEGDIKQVVAIDVISGEMQVLYEGQNWPREPRVSGNYVVWTDLESLHIYNLESGQSEQKDFGIARFAHISSDTVVWQSTGDIEGYYLNTNERFFVANDPNVVESLPLISGEWVVFLTSTESFNAADLWAMNIQTQEHIYMGEIPLWHRDEEYLDSVYAVSAPWVTWASKRALNLYNLDSRTSYTVPVESCVYTRTNPMGEMTVEHWKPSRLAISENTIIFSCSQRMGYDIQRGVFFSLPVNIHEIPEGELDGWAIADDQLIWVLTENAFGPQEQSHIYTAQIERSP